MADKKETQVFDQSDLDSLMAEIQEAETDSNADEASEATDETSAAEAESIETDAPPGSSEIEATLETKSDEVAIDQDGKALEQKDLDGLINELHHDVDDQTAEPASEPEEQTQDNTPDEDHSPESNAKPEASTIDAKAPSSIDDTDVQTIDQSELEDLIRELQEGVETPEIEQSQETVENETTNETPTSAPVAPLEPAPEADAQESTNEEPADPAPDTATLKTADPEVQVPQKSEKEIEVPDVTLEPSGSRDDADQANTAISTAPSVKTPEDDLSPTEVKIDQTSGEAKIETVQRPHDRVGEEQAAVKQKARSQGSRRKLVAGLVIATLLIAVASGILYLKLRTEPMPDAAIEPSSVEKSAPLSTEPVEGSLSIVNVNKAPLEPVDRVALIKDKLEEANALRDDLLTKQDEVLALKQHYQDGISAIQKEIREEQRKNGIKSYPRAIRNNRIELGLQTIQRRMAYMEQLNKPLAWLSNASEELLFTKRLITIDIRMLDTVSGIDLEQLEGQIIEALENYQPSVGRLAISHGSTDLPPLKSLWDQMFPSTLGRTKQVKAVPPRTDGRNQVIWKEICSSNYQHKTELTALSPDAAKCLAQAGEADLFLNGVTTLTPEAAKYLFRWEGNWICLNGLSQISSETARYLFNWNGNWISLNGLHELRADAARYLVQWPGRQLELMGLDFKGQPHELHMLTYLAQWKQSGGKLYVPDKIEKQIDKLME